MPRGDAPLLRQNAGSARRNDDEHDPRYEHGRHKQGIAHNAAAVSHSVAQKPLEADEQIHPRYEGGKPNEQTYSDGIEMNGEKRVGSCRRIGPAPRLRPREGTIIPIVSSHGPSSPNAPEAFKSASSLYDAL